MLHYAFAWQNLAPSLALPYASSRRVSQSLTGLCLLGSLIVWEDKRTCSLSHDSPHEVLLASVAHVPHPLLGDPHSADLRTSQVLVDILGHLMGTRLMAEKEALRRHTSRLGTSRGTRSHDTHDNHHEVEVQLCFERPSRFALPFHLEPIVC